jgi:hypothetical protein
MRDIDEILYVPQLALKSSLESRHFSLHSNTLINSKIPTSFQKPEMIALSKELQSVERRAFSPQVK